MKLRPDQTIHERVAILEEALATVLDRGGEMSVEPFDQPGTMHVWVIGKPFSEERVGHSLEQIAREMEALLQ